MLSHFQMLLNVFMLMSFLETNSMHAEIVANEGVLQK